MKFNKFEDILVWQKAVDLGVLVYKKLGSCKDFSFKNQMERAAVSVSYNIAEGFERMSNKDFKNFLFISKGSCGEVRSMVHLGLKLEYWNEQDVKDIFLITTEISKMLSGLIKVL